MFGVLYTDATNKVPRSCAGFVLKTDEMIYEVSKLIGGGRVWAVNECEYNALIFGLDFALDRGVTKIHIFSDSQLMVRHLTGEYQVRAQNLLPYFNEACLLLSKFLFYKITWIPRAKNVRADELASMGGEFVDFTENTDGITEEERKSL